MVASGAAELGPTPAQTRSMLRQLQAESILLVLPVLSIAGFVLIISEDRFRDPLQGSVPGAVLLLWPALVWLVRRRSYLAAAWVLVGGFTFVILFFVAWTGIDEPLYLLSLAAGLTALLIGPTTGALTAGAFTMLLATTPMGLLPRHAGLCLAALLGTWSTVGLIWLTTRPLLTTLQWSWSSYEQSRRLLEQARDYQVQLKQTLADLADANVQLTRLNRLAAGLRQEAEEARRAKEQFVANVSHELRTPLNMIIGFSEMIVRSPQVYADSFRPALAADLSVILRNSQHLSSLIDDVLDLSQIESRQMALSKERVVLGEIVEAATTAVRPLFESKGLYLKTEVADELPSLLCDRTRIREVLLNLLSNAGRFTERGGVRLRAWREGNEVTVSVADTGPGIATEDQDRIFQPFQQLDGSIRRRYGGSGLGLSISKSFVELHNGRMWLESAVGIGTTFFFRLPIDSPAAKGGGMSRWFNPHWHYEERTHPSLAPAAVIPPRYVVLEAGDALQRLLGRYLHGAEIAAVTDLEEASADLARTPARALLINEASVGEVLERLGASAAMPQDTPVIVCSVPGIQEAAGALGVSDYLVKPISCDALLGALDRLELAGKTVLVADDEPEAQRLFWRMLASAGRGYRVLTAGDGRQTLTMLREEHPDVLLLDLVMPEMDGFQVLAARKVDPVLQAIPVVAISARDPLGQPIVASALAVTRRSGLSVPQLLGGIEGLARLFG